MKIYDELDLFTSDVVIGTHSIWLPKLRVKVPFQWGGFLQKYKHIQENLAPLSLLWEEVEGLRYLSRRRVVPPIGDFVYFKTLISEHPGGWWADPCGAYGYEMADATKLAPGFINNDGEAVSLKIKRMTKAFVGSPGAWNDLNKPGNVVNGYLIDMHRSAWDRLRWTRGQVHAPVMFQEDSTVLREELKTKGQFPYKERTEPYQEHVLGKWWPGEREVVHRSQLLGFFPRPGQTVLDIGTQLGGFLHWAVQLNGPPLRPLYVGIDSQLQYIDLARKLARANGWNLCFRQCDVGKDLELILDWLGHLWPKSPEHLLLLSMLKHLKGGEQDIWDLHTLLKPKTLYLETNAVNEKNPWPLLDAVQKRGGVFLGNSHDRNERHLYSVPEPRLD